MPPRPLAGGLLAMTLLSSCSGALEKHNTQRAQQLQEANARYLMRLCVTAVERRRAVDPANQLPAALNGQPCGSPLLREYALDPQQTGLAASSVIQLDATRLSAYTVTVTGKDGQTYTYVDRGVQAAAAEQAGTFDPPGTLSPTPEDQGADQPELLEQEE